MTEISRRALLTGATITAALGTIGISLPVSAADVSATDQQMNLFIGLSAALTGIDKRKLAPGR